MKRIRLLAAAAAMLLSCTAGLLPQGAVVPVTAQTLAADADNGRTAGISPQTSADDYYDSSGVKLDTETGLLTLSGAFNFQAVWAMPDLDRYAVKNVVCTEGTVMPEFCSQLFHGYFNAETIDLSNADGLNSNITDLSMMFSDCRSLKSVKLPNWDTSKVTRMDYMFGSCVSLPEVDLSSLDTSSVTNMEKMFYECEALTELDLSGFNTESVTRMTGMFYSCKSLSKLDLSGFDTANVTSFCDMFMNCYKLGELNVSGFDTSSAQYMHNMFRNCQVLETLDVSGFDTSNVVSMYYMFCGCNSLKELDVSRFDTSNVTRTEWMFSGCKLLTELDVSGFDTSNVTNMSRMFMSCAAVTELDLTGFNTANVTDMSSMFAKCSALKMIRVGDGWSTANAAANEYMFGGCNALEGGCGTVFDEEHTDAEYARIDSADAPGYFTSAEGPEIPPVEEGVTFDEETGILYLSGRIAADDVKAYAGNDAVKKVIALEGTVFPEICSGLFKDFQAEEMDLSKADTSRTTMMDDMFSGCEKLTELDFTGENTALTEDFSEMFLDCAALTEILVSDKWSTQNAIASADMFKGCVSLVGGCGTAYDEAHSDILYARVDSEYAPGYLTNDGSVIVTPPDKPHFGYDWQTGIVTLFGPLSADDLRDFRLVTDVKKVVADEGAVLPADCKGMFAYIKAEIIDLSKADCSAVTDMTGMFGLCTELTTIIVPESWNTENVTASDDMFVGDTKLVGGSGTAYDAEHIDAEYARIDTADAPGYFTAKQTVIGDANGDGSIGTDDAMLLMRYVNGWENIDIDMRAVDFNHDGTVDTADAMILARYINGWEGYDSYFTSDQA